MAQTSEGRSSAARFSLRTIAMIVGLVGSGLALVVNVLYSSFHVLGRVVGISSDSGHFFVGLLIVLVGLAGSCLAPILPFVGGLMLALAGVGFFFVVGWWALIVSPFFFVAALLTLSNRRVSIPATE